MMYLVGMALGAALFILFGMIRPRVECNGSSCSGCGLACHRRDESGEPHHE